MASRSSTTRAVDVNRRSQVDESIVSGQQQLTKQQEQIRALTEENEQIKSDINALSGKHYDYAKADKLATLMGEADALERRYQFEKMKKNDLTKKQQLARIDLMQSRKMRGGVNASKEQEAAVQRQVDILENRLDQALGKFNDALLYNKELREQIDVIREERRVFQRVHKKMEDDLRAKQRQMAAQIEQTNKDMDERDMYLRQIEEYSRSIAEQQNEHNEQLKEMDVAMMEIKAMREDQTNLQLELESREYDFNSRLEDTKREQANSELGGSQAQVGTLSRSRGVGGDGGSEAGDAFGDTVATTGGGTTSLARETANILDTYNQIKEGTREEDMEAMRAEYLRLGDNNFSLYKYINELTATREELRDEVRDLKLLVSEETEASAQQRRLIKDLEEKLAVAEYQLEQLQAAVGGQHSAVRRVAAATEDVYTHVGCPPTDEVCGETNLMAYLGAIEDRATHILCAAQRKERATSHARALAAVYESTKEAHDGKMGADDDDDNALTEGTTGAPEPLSADALLSRGAGGVGGGASQTSPGAGGAEDEEEEEVMAPMPNAPQTTHSAVSAQRLVRAVELPSASIATGGVTANDGFEDDRIVSHEEIRQQMEQRLQAKREREERNARKKK